MTKREREIIALLREELGTALTGALVSVFQTPALASKDLNDANITDVVGNVASALHGIRKAILPQGVTPAPGPVNPDGQVGCLTEAILEVAAGLQAIADAINNHD